MHLHKRRVTEAAFYFETHLTSYRESVKIDTKLCCKSEKIRQRYIECAFLVLTFAQLTLITLRSVENVAVFRAWCACSARCSLFWNPYPITYKFGQSQTKFRIPATMQAVARPPFPPAPIEDQIVVAVIVGSGTIGILNRYVFHQRTVNWIICKVGGVSLRYLSVRLEDWIRDIDHPFTRNACLVIVKLPALIGWRLISAELSTCISILKAILYVQEHGVRHSLFSLRGIWESGVLGLAVGFVGLPGIVFRLIPPESRIAMTTKFNTFCASSSKRVEIVVSKVSKVLLCIAHPVFGWFSRRRYGLR